MLSDFPILLILTDREHRRLASQVRRLRTYALDADQLSQLRESWSATLGYMGYLTPVLDALDHLIGELEQGEYDTDDYDEVIHQISQYRRASWKAIRQTLGSTRPYLDRWGKVRPDYRYAFEREYEPQAKLSTAAQGHWLRALLTQLGFPVGEAEGEFPESHDPNAMEAMRRQCRVLLGIELEQDTLQEADDPSADEEPVTPTESSHPHGDDEGDVAPGDTGGPHLRDMMSLVRYKRSHNSKVVDLSQYRSRHHKENQEPPEDE